MSKKVASSSVSRGVISGEISGLEASEKADEGILGNSSSAKRFRERNGFGDERAE